MKKILFASTALVAAGMMNAGAAEAADKIKINIGGFSKWYVAGIFQADEFQSVGAGGGTAVNANIAAQTNGSGHKANVNVLGDNEIWFSGDTTLDNGLKVGVFVSLEAGGHTDLSTDVIDASYAWVEGGFGKVMLGTHNNGTALLHVQAPDVSAMAGAGGLAGGYLVSRPSSVMGPNGIVGWTGTLQTTAIVTDDKAEKITYVAPSFYGLTVGASYVPNVTRQDVRVNTADRAQAAGAGALYANTFGPVGLKVSAGVVWADLGAGGVYAEKALVQQAYGTNVSYAGFTLGGSYQRAAQDHGGQKPGSVAGTALNTSLLSAAGDTRGGVVALSTVKGGNQIDFGGYAYDAGLSYASGPYSIGFTYFHSSTIGIVNSTIRNGKDDTIDAYSVGGKYNLGPGVDLVGLAGYVDYKDQRKGSGANAQIDNAYENSGWAVLSGVQLTF